MTMREGAAILTEKTPLKTTIGAAAALVVALASILYGAWQARESEVAQMRAETKQMIDKAVEPMLKRDEFYQAMRDLEIRLRDKLDQRR